MTARVDRVCVYVVCGRSKRRRTQQVQRFEMKQIYPGGGKLLLDSVPFRSLIPRRGDIHKQEEISDGVP